MSATANPREWFDGIPRVMFVHAHPDDETIATGGTLAGLTDAGLEPLLVTLTRGECGEVVSGPLEALVSAHGLAVVRQNELKVALSMLGIERHAFLGVPPARAAGLQPYIYEDSGMTWGDDGWAVPADNTGADALTSVPAVWALNDLLAAAVDSGAQALVSYNDGGGYGHPDHRRAHQLTRAVAHALDLPFWEIFSGDADDESIAHDVTPWLDRKIAALRAHQTQLTLESSGVDRYDIVHVGGQRHAVSQVEVFRRSR
ncbi:MAG: PIG-L deacetylase family protein [Leucobacter sp.]